MGARSEEGPWGGILLGGARTNRGSLGASEPFVSSGARSEKGPRGGILLGGARTNRGTLGASEPFVSSGARSVEGPRGGFQSAGGARTEKGPKGAFESSVEGCSCGQRKIFCRDRSATRATKSAWVLARVELDASPDVPVVHRITSIQRIAAPDFSRKRKDREVSSGWLVLDSASAAAVPGTSDSSCARCGEPLSL
jgi:hypothetical protein